MRNCEIGSGRRCAAALAGAMMAMAGGGFSLSAADDSDAAQVIELWPDGVPGEWSIEGDEIREDGEDEIVRVRNVSAPSLSYFPAEEPDDSAPAMIICPGGGYHILAIDHEGWEVAEFLAKRGIHAFVLKYRLPRKDDAVRHGPPLQDTQRAVSIVRSRAADFGFSPDRIGLMGFSAGGHLTAAASNQFGERTYEPVDAADDASPRPDFAALIYPAYLTTGPDTAELAPELPVSPETPPTFLVQTQDDRIPVENSLYYALELKKADVPVELHVFAEGGHGYGLRAPEKPVGQWGELLANWIRWRASRPKE